MKVNPPILDVSSEAPSLRGQTLTAAPQDTSLVAREPAMTSGTVATLASAAAIVAAFAKLYFGVEIPNELLDATVELIALLIPIVAPLVAAKFTRERVTPVK